MFHLMHVSKLQKIYKKLMNFIVPPKSKSLTMQHMNVNDDDNLETTIYSPSATNDGDGLSNGGVLLFTSLFVLFCVLLL
jgi:hypothetical protein